MGEVEFDQGYEVCHIPSSYAVVAVVGERDTDEAVSDPVVLIVEAVVSVVGMAEVVDVKKSLLPVVMSDVIGVDTGHPLIEVEVVPNEAFAVRGGSLGAAVGAATG